MKKTLLCLVVTFFALNINAQTTIAEENFDGTSTWSNDAATQTFVDPSSPDQGLFIQAGTDLGPDNVLFGRDLQNESGEPDLNPVTITFNDVNISTANSVVVSFEYDLNGFDSTDKLEYELTVDGVLVDDGAFGGSDVGTYTFNVADGANSVSLKIILTQNGAQDSFELDNFKVEGVLTMPVEFTTIRATKNAKSVDVAWQTASELNNEMFVVERSKDGINFTAIGEVEGQGTSTRIQNYLLTDDAPLTGVSYYRVKQVDFDGAYDYSEMVSVTMDVKSIRVTPTATYDITTIYAEESTEIVVYDMTGATVTNMLPQNGQYDVDLSNAAKGIYMAVISYGTHTETVKLIRL